jgi:putative ABC transport system permease protein
MNFLTEISEGLKISWAAIRANKLRSTLTTLGIIIGVVTVTLMGTAIEGLNRAFLKSISIIGADVLYVQRFDWFNHSYADWLKVQKRKPITIAQADALAKQLTLARAVAPVADTQARVQFKNRRSDNVMVLGTTDQFLHTGNLTITEGRFLSGSEAEGGRPVCIIGAQVATNLFPKESPVGNKIMIGPRAFEVIGVLDKFGSFLDGTSLDNQAIIPINQFINVFWHDPDYQIQVKAITPAQLEDAREELRLVMRRIRKVAPTEPDDFSINQQDQILTMFHRVAGTIAAIGFFITGLSLFVGGIGIMNIMFVSVAERTKEIGIRKAIGAKRRTILVQFLIEAACVCLIGGLIALGIAWPITLVMQKFMPATLSPLVVSIALLVSLMTGVVSGFLPAWRAARMNVVDALRNE